MLTTGKLTNRHRDIVRLREGEKKILQSGADYCRMMREGWERETKEKILAATKTDITVAPKKESNPQSTQSSQEEAVVAKEEKEKIDNTSNTSNTVTKLTNGHDRDHGDGEHDAVDTSDPSCDTSDPSCDTTDHKNQKASNIVDTTAIS